MTFCSETEKMKKWWFHVPVVFSHHGGGLYPVLLIYPMLCKDTRNVTTFSENVASKQQGPQIS